MDSTASIILAIAIMVIMMGMGLSLTLADFKRVAQNPKPVLLGLTNQIVLLPLVALALVYFFAASSFYCNWDDSISRLSRRNVF